MKPFSLCRIPVTYIGQGTISKVFYILKERRFASLLLVTGKQSFKNGKAYLHVKNGLDGAGIPVTEASIPNEPSPGMVDEITQIARQNKVDVVLAIGGGSVLDAGKAISAMLPVEGSVSDYLEGVGTKSHDGSKIPFIAVPTTSGTGSEATKNAVLSRVGENGFKKSLRHDNFVPDYAILDPELTAGCPRRVTAASGMDALNQLLEGYLSSKANPFTDALALSGIGRVLASLVPLCVERPEDLNLRQEMSYAAYLSGIVLANAGLGYVHGFAGVIGGLLDIPHGVVCGKLNAPVFEALVETVLKNREQYGCTFQKISLLCDLAKTGGKEEERMRGLIDLFYSMEEKLKLPSLDSYGLTPDLAERAVSETSPKECPVRLSSEVLKAIVLS